MNRLLKLGGRFIPKSAGLLIGAVALMLASGFYLARGVASQSLQQNLQREEVFKVQDGRYCSQTAQTLFRACGRESQDDFLVTSAKCNNLVDEADRNACLEDAITARNEKEVLCAKQLAGRRETCAAIGEARYDPDLDPEDFETDFTNLRRANPYFPLKVGNKWEFRGSGETAQIEVLSDTKLIEGVTCIVVDDRVMVNGNLSEHTDDWYAQAKDRNVWYFGEEVKDYETFDGDKPRKPELVSTAGSFKEGVNGDRAGIIFQAAPKVGQIYLEEFSLGNAEDVTEILSINYAYGKNRELDELMPRALAERFCAAGDCVVTKNYSLLEPGVFARKYYARGIGVFFEVKPDEGTFIQLTSCNFDARCQGLSAPEASVNISNAGARKQRAKAQ